MVWFRETAFRGLRSATVSIQITVTGELREFKIQPCSDNRAGRALSFLSLHVSNPFFET